MELRKQILFKMSRTFSGFDQKVINLLKKIVVFYRIFYKLDIVRIIHYIF